MNPTSPPLPSGRGAGVRACHLRKTHIPHPPRFTCVDLSRPKSGVPDLRLTEVDLGNSRDQGEMGLRLTGSAAHPVVRCGRSQPESLSS